MTDTLVATTETGTLTKKTRTRRYRKRTKLKQIPLAPWPVRALWETATAEERTRAHHMCTTFLELWVGKITKKEAIERLGIPPLRLWQLSQQALSGMAAGLLVQPKKRPKGKPVLSEPEVDVKTLEKEKAKLEEENRLLRDLLALFRDLPGNRERPIEKEKPNQEGASPASSPAMLFSAGSNRTPRKNPRGRPRQDRRVDPFKANPPTGPEQRRNLDQSELPRNADMDA